MNYTPGIVVFITVIIVIAHHVTSYRKRYVQIGDELKSRLDQGLPVDVEILEGYFKIVRIISDDLLSVVRIQNRCLVGHPIEVFVSRDMSRSIVVDRVYLFHFDEEDHEVFFDCMDPISTNSVNPRFSPEEIVTKDIVLQGRIFKYL